MSSKKPRGNKGKGTIIDAQRVGGLYQVDPAAITVIGVDTPHTSRRADSDKGHFLYDERAFLPREQAKINWAADHGVTGVVTVVKDGDMTVVIDGHQRVLDLREGNKIRAGRGQKPLLLKIMFERGKRNHLQLVMQAGNAMATPEDPVTMAAKIADYVNENGDCEEVWRELENLHRCSRRALRDKLKLLDLDAKVQQKVQRGQLAASAAVTLAELPREEQRAKLEDLLANPANVTETGKVKTRAVKAAAGVEAKERPSARRIKAVREALKESQVVTERTLAVLDWVLGDITDEKFAEIVPGVKLEHLAIA